MTLSNGRRRLPLLLLAAAAVAAITGVLVSSGRSGASAGDMPAMSHAEMAAMSTSAPSARAVAFRVAMDKLWEDHVNWTRMVVVDFAAGLPDLEVAEARLLRNQADIGNALKPFYGRAAGAQLTGLLRTHILQAVTVLEAAKAGDKAALARAQKAWYANAHQIAAFLAKANPQHWKLPTMTSMMNVHLALTTQEAVARLQGKWNADVVAFDHVHDEILEMSQMLAAGIVDQFPERF